MRHVLCAASLAIAAAHAAAPESAWPTERWRTADAAALGVDANALATLNAEFASGKYPLVDGLFVARCGSAVYDTRYRHDYGSIFYKEAHTKGALNARLTGPYNYFDPAWHPYYHGTFGSVKMSM